MEKNKSTESGRRFWRYVEETAGRVARWLAWKKEPWIVPLEHPDDLHDVSKGTCSCGAWH